jgi:putative membrane protein
MTKRHTISGLRKEKDGDFDHDFLKKIAKDHEADIKQFEKVSRNAKDPEIRSWAEKMLPALRDHLAAARQLQGVPGTSASP